MFVIASTSILSQLTSGSDLGGDLVPHHHGMALRVTLGHDRQQLARSRLSQAFSTELVTIGEAILIGYAQALGLCSASGFRDAAEQ